MASRREVHIDNRILTLGFSNSAPGEKHFSLEVIVVSFTLRLVAVCFHQDYLESRRCRPELCSIGISEASVVTGKCSGECEWLGSEASCAAGARTPTFSLRLEEVLDRPEYAR